ncbi:MAG: F0F1 ATP synthase subunit A, partial [Anaerolineae bacterium]|nr:F0F1 ATP synthase subunit A [Anaerolineae bacterium]
PFVLLPSWNSAVTLPVITVPAEYYRQDWPSPNFELVNTLGGALLANIIVVLVALGVWRASKGWTKEVPGRFQGFVELIVNIWWGLTKEQAGDSPKTKNVLFPLVASIFFFLFAANVGKLIPGVESVGVLHCAAYSPVAFNGLPIVEREFLGAPYFTYRVEAPLQTGTRATSDSYHQCEAMLGEHKYIKDGYLPTELDPFLDQAVTVEVEDGMTLEDVLADAEAQLEAAVAAGLPGSEGRAEIQAELEAGEYDAIAIDYDDPYAIYNSFREVELSFNDIIVNNSNAEGVVTLAFAGDDAHGEDGEHHEAETLEIDGVTYTLPAGATLETPLEAGQTVVVRQELIGSEATTRANQLYTVAPFVRGVATDLSFTIGLAILAFIAIQYFGLSTLGPDYLQKFINLRALGNAGSNPIGAVDFIVGLFEIVSEFGKIISLAFRLFGAIFAGSVLFVVFMFLTGTLIPVIILLLELIVGVAQAAVFAVLTLIFSAQAMISHHHEDHDEHGEHDEHGQHSHVDSLV